VIGSGAEEPMFGIPVTGFVAVPEDPGMPAIGNTVEGGSGGTAEVGGKKHNAKKSNGDTICSRFLYHCPFALT